jgi:polyketide cyclase/dehydrase/lipid transport protein
MTEFTRVRLEGTVAVPLSPAHAFELFTPSGERRWVQGWDPTFPAPSDDETRPGTVFRTAQRRRVTWVVVARRRPHSITYANVSEDDRAGLVQVRCEPDGSGATTARVSYEMTALSDDGDAALHEFAAQYQQYMQHWQDAIAAAVSPADAR